MSFKFLPLIKIFQCLSLMLAVGFPVVGASHSDQEMGPKGAIYYQVNTVDSIYYAKFNHRDMGNFFAIPGRLYSRNKAKNSIPTGSKMEIDLYDHHDPDVSEPVGRIVVTLPTEKNETVKAAVSLVDGLHKNVELLVHLKRAALSHEYIYEFRSF